MLTEQIEILILVTGRYQFLQAKNFEIEKEVFEEIADLRVITVAIHDFVPKMLLVMTKLVFNIRKLGIELIILCPFSLVHVSIRRHFFIGV